MDNLLFAPSCFIRTFQKLEAKFGFLSEIHSFGQPWSLVTYRSTTSASRSADQFSRVGMNRAHLIDRFTTTRILPHSLPVALSLEFGNS